MKPINRRIAEELGVREQQITATISLLDGGATVPFVARYRKEATGGLDDAQLRTLEERLRYLRELDERRAAILESISQQGNSTRRSSMKSRRRTARRGSRIFICLFGRSGGRKPKSRAKQASSLWQRRCSRDPTNLRSRWLADMSNRVKE
jgi:hypothetical protein